MGTEWFQHLHTLCIVALAEVGIPAVAGGLVGCAVWNKLGVVQQIHISKSGSMLSGLNEAAMKKKNQNKTKLWPRFNKHILCFHLNSFLCVYDSHPHKNDENARTFENSLLFIPILHSVSHDFVFVLVVFDVIEEGLDTATYTLLDNHYFQFWSDEYWHVCNMTQKIILPPVCRQQIRKMLDLLSHDRNCLEQKSACTWMSHKASDFIMQHDCFALFVSVGAYPFLLQNSLDCV